MRFGVFPHHAGQKPLDQYADSTDLCLKHHFDIGRIAMLKKLFGFGADKRIAFNQALVDGLRSQLNIELDPDLSPKIGFYTGFVDLSSEYFYKKRTPEHCALAIGLLYFKGLSSSRNLEEKSLSKQLAPKLIRAAEVFEREGKISDEIKRVVIREVNNLT